MCSVCMCVCTSIVDQDVNAPREGCHRLSVQVLDVRLLGQVAPDELGSNIVVSGIEVGFIICFFNIFLFTKISNA